MDCAAPETRSLVYRTYSSAYVHARRLSGDGMGQPALQRVTRVLPLFQIWTQQNVPPTQHAPTLPKLQISRETPFNTKGTHAAAGIVAIGGCLRTGSGVVVLASSSSFPLASPTRRQLAQSYARCSPSHRTSAPATDGNSRPCDRSARTPKTPATQCNTATINLPLCVVAHWSLSLSLDSTPSDS